MATTEKKENNSIETTEKKENTTFEIGVAVHEKFEHITDAKFVSSTEFCAVVSQLFSLYEDFEGCSFDVMPGTNNHMISLYFNHKMVDADPETHTIAITRDTGVSAKNNTLRSTRNFTNRLYNGDKFYLTKDGKEGLRPFFAANNRSIYKANYEINWDKVTLEVADSNMGMPQQYTKVTFLDPAKIAEAIYGKTDEDGVTWLYDVRVLRSFPSIAMNNGNASNSFMLEVRRVCEPEVIKLCQKFGIGTSSGLNIIR